MFPQKGLRRTLRKVRSVQEAAATKTGPDHGLWRTSSGRVEVSGWDKEENFFVEKATLRNSVSGRKSIAIRARLRVGSLVFLRKSEGFSSDCTVPVAYQVASYSANENQGALEAQLVQLHPKRTARGDFREFPFQEVLLN